MKRSGSLVAAHQQERRKRMKLDTFDFSGFSEANRENIVSLYQEQGWTIVVEGFEVWAFRWASAEA
jgi:hypothetical protein